MRTRPGTPPGPLIAAAARRRALPKGRRTATRVAEIEPERSREEIARMLAGAEITRRGPRRGGAADPRGGGVRAGWVRVQCLGLKF